MPKRVIAREGVQYEVCFELEIPWDGVNPATGAAISTVATHVIDIHQLPPGARVVGGEIVNDVQAVGPTVATISIGIVGAVTKYSAAVSRLAAAGTRTALTLTGEAHVNGAMLIANYINTVAAATAGKVWVRVAYVVQDRQHENMG